MLLSVQNPHRSLSLMATSLTPVYIIELETCPSRVRAYLASVLVSDSSNLSPNPSEPYFSLKVCSRVKIHSTKSCFHDSCFCCSYRHQKIVLNCHPNFNLNRYPKNSRPNHPLFVTEENKRVEIYCKGTLETFQGSWHLSAFTKPQHRNSHNICMVSAARVELSQGPSHRGTGPPYA